MTNPHEVRLDEFSLNYYNNLHRNLFDIWNTVTRWQTEMMKLHEH